MIRRLAICLGAIVVGLLSGFFSQPAAQAHESAGQSEATYTYARDRNAVAAAHTATERGPPASCSNHTLDGADDLWSGGASARSVVITTYAYTDHSNPERPSQVGGIGGTTRQPCSAHVGDLSSSTRFGVAAESGATSFVGHKGVTKFFGDGSHASYGGEISIGRGTNPREA